jgi:hypothetical protein
LAIDGSKKIPKTVVVAVFVTSLYEVVAVVPSLKVVWSVFVMSLNDVLAVKPSLKIV